MMAVNSLHIAVHLIVSSGASSKWLLSCCRACSAGAFTPHFEQPSNVQMSCLDRVRSLAVDAFADRLAASSTAPPSRRCQERQRGAKVEGKIKGRGTLLREKAVCTWGRRDTRWLRHRAAWIANTLSALSQARASHAWLRQPWMGVAHEQQR
ncbi:hypothetical protein L1889_15785 [Paenalcaligenes niemegkensis]|uniref:hypothetical protein n=1 Tax=Paenalcaligenes niemegkensis TaxID=2895469 RepID=UPI001EE90A51|nr:hypothetical protein [Paenalcaligenes niemegkensis]MCQ9617948.1 hypothetical protein [Paenalcaligenes niemegkensis]